MRGIAVQSVAACTIRPADPGEPMDGNDAVYTDATTREIRMKDRARSGFDVSAEDGQPRMLVLLGDDPLNDANWALRDRDGEQRLSDPPTRDRWQAEAFRRLVQNKQRTPAWMEQELARFVDEHHNDAGFDRMEPKLRNREEEDRLDANAVEMIWPGAVQATDGTELMPRVGVYDTPLEGIRKESRRVPTGTSRLTPVGCEDRITALDGRQRFQDRVARFSEPIATHPLDFADPHRYAGKLGRVRLDLNAPTFAGPTAGNAR